ncbi:MAG: cytochrome c4 [Gammaproteobacteria bacterium]|nr:cytochrome c4 [Gammaproteobacteria bacterium]MCW9005173.1 cytochrome c4 [Gammaproteobacteria bacterium]MCW9057191.1 cytochrome c4 [Gammaproteobacteria bacterium]
MKFKLLVAVFGLALSVNTSAMAAGDAAAGEAKAAACFGCHMPDGNSVVDQFPKLAGQHEKYSVKQLSEFKSMKRKNDIMLGMAAALSDQDMADLGAYFASKTATPAVADESKVALGKDVYRGGNMNTGVPACMGCHGPTGAGNPTAGYPSLGGQHAAYTLAQLNAFRDGARDNDPAGMMRNVVARMSKEEIEAVANYIAIMK